MVMERMKTRDFWNWLALIVIMGAALRLPWLGSVPRGMYIDEYSNGYDAYSILLTGMDQHGVRYPLFFRALDDYRTPLHIYLSVPVTMLFGFGEMQTRLPYALAGIVTIVTTACLAQSLYGSREALIAAALVAFSPWDIHYSRMADSHATMLGMLIPFGICLLVSGVRSRPRRLRLGFIVMAISFYSYPTSLLFVPLFLVGFVAIFHTELSSNKRALTVSLACLVLLALPGYSPWWLQTATSRFSDVLVRIPHGGEPPSDAKPTSPGRLMVDNYLSSFSPNFLFITGDANLRYSPRDVGQLHIVEAFLLLGGVAALLAGRKRPDLVVLLWLVIGPLPAALTQNGGQNVGRLFIWLPALHIAAARGATRLASWSARERYSLIMPVLGVVALLGMALFLDAYFVRYPEDVLAQYRYRVGQGTALRIAGDAVGAGGIVHVAPFTMIGSNIVQAYEYDIAPHLESPPFHIVTSLNTCTFLDASPDQHARDAFIIAPMQPFDDPSLPFRLPPDCEPGAHGLVEIGRVRYSNGVPSHFIFEASEPGE